ncbi:hypothetical protein PZ938_16175 [Luteipulveratus sp. YIM 133132]|uniref:DUF6801 domain-containing protein n=1 Tax=Luteipulveratus flavus TaxID=3031728 RepID=UPI0023AE9A8A|nr:DUF6801 domain-containing protein [Luteipulveratus sp. YIM 133132]MDE9367156.1 hypothetical protein [Luteipulveratus sp. YIM 133132]
MRTFAASRRLGRTAGALGGVGLALAATCAFAPSAGAAELTGLKYHCSLTDEDGGLGKDFKDDWSLTISAELPATVRPKHEVDPLDFTAKITLGADALQYLRDHKITMLDAGGSVHFYTVGSDDLIAFTEFDVPTPVSTKGTVTFKGEGEGLPFTPKKTGTLDVTVGEMLVAVGREDAQEADLFVACEPVKGQNLTLGTIAVTKGGGQPSPTTQPSSTTEPSPSTEPSESATAVPTGTASSGSGSATDEPSSTVSGPVVQADLVGDDSGSNTGVALAGLAVLGGFAGAGVLARRNLRR